MGHWSHIIYGTNDQVFYSSAKTRKNKDIKNMKWQNNIWVDTNFNFEIEKRQKHLGIVPTVLTLSNVNLSESVIGNFIKSGAIIYIYLQMNCEK